MSRFWFRQPIMKTFKDESPFPKRIKEIKDIKKDSYKLPEDFYWYDFNIEDLPVIKKFLNLYYIEDLDSIFRLQYSVDQLKWWLFPPDSKDATHLAIKYKNTFVGTISAIPGNMKLFLNNYKMGIVNFLCVHGSMRNMRLAPVLIKELLRRGYLLDYYESIYSVSKAISFPICSSRCYFYPINIKKLVNHNFMEIKPRMTLTRTIKLYKLPNEPYYNFIMLTDEYYESAYQLYQKYMDIYDMYQCITFKQFIHWFMPSNFLYTYVLINDHKEVTDIISFYSLPSKVIRTNYYINAVYSWYNIGSTLITSALIKDALILAKIKGFDTYKCMNIMENCNILRELKFMETDGTLHYFSYNLSMKHIQNDKMGYNFF